MNLKNESYVIYIGTKNFTEKYYKDRDGWIKVSAKGRKFRITAEQFLNHLLPAIAKIKPNLIWKVEHVEDKKELPVYDIFLNLKFNFEIDLGKVNYLLDFR